MPEVVPASYPINVSYLLSIPGKEWVMMAPLRAGREGSLPALKYLSISFIYLQMETYIFSLFKPFSHPFLLERKKLQLMITLAVYPIGLILFTHSLTY